MIQRMNISHSVPASPPPSYLFSNMPKQSTNMYDYGASSDSDDRSPELCRYPSKRCNNLRSEKRGGGLHRFCAHHRERANINQRRVDHRRRLRRQGLPVPPIERVPTAYAPTPSAIKQEHEGRRFGGGHMDVELFDSEISPLPLLPDLNDHDLQELMRVLDHIDTSQPFLIKQEEDSDANKQRVTL